MSRTYRRRGERHDYDWVPRDCRWVNGALVPVFVDPRSNPNRDYKSARRIMDAPFIGSPIRWLVNDRLYVRLADIDVPLFAQRAKGPGSRAGSHWLGCGPGRRPGERRGCSLQRAITNPFLEA
jgi:hypothetical protein